jgi:flagellar basal body-associated protein FliL
MSANRMEPPKPGAESAKGAEPKAAEPAAKGGGALGSWLPLIVAAVLMPAIAYAMTTYVMLPKLKSTMGAGNEEAPAAKTAASSGHGEKAETKKGGESSGHEAKGQEAKGHEAKGAESKKGGAAAKKFTAPLEKIIGTVANTQGSRYLLVKITLVGASEAFKDQVEENRDQLMDVASSALSSKTLGDLEKPGNRNLIRAELITAANNVLGPDTVQDIYFTEFNIQ